MRVNAVVFDVGNVLLNWQPEALYQRLIPSAREREAFLSEVLTRDWHFQHDLGRAFAETSAELIARFPQHASLIGAWGERFGETITGIVSGMDRLVARLDAAGVPLFAITNFSHEFFPPVRARYSALFSCFRDIVVSGEERLAKPDPAIYALALKRFGLEPSQGLFVDDVAANVAAARANGFAGHHFRDAHGLSAELRALGLIDTD